jgi:hypothetical protein
MDIFFNRKKSYTVNDSMENLRDKIKYLTDQKWHDFTYNFFGEIKNDNSFILKPKWNFLDFSFRGPIGSSAYLSGILKEDGMNTIIETNLRPNSFGVILFYFFISLFLLQLFGITIMSDSKVTSLILLVLFLLIISVSMLFYSNILRRRFERFLFLNR